MVVMGCDRVVIPRRSVATQIIACRGANETERSKLVCAKATNGESTVHGRGVPLVGLVLYNVIYSDSHENV